MDKRLILVLLLMPLVQASMIREMPEYGEGSLAPAALFLQDVQIGQTVVLGETLTGAFVSNWTIEGAKNISFQDSSGLYIWKFIATKSDPVIRYWMNGSGNISMETVYVLPPDSYGYDEAHIYIENATESPPDANKEPSLPTATAVSEKKADRHLFPMFVIVSFVILSGFFAFKNLPEIQRPPTLYRSMEETVEKAQVQIVQGNLNEGYDMYMELLQDYRCLNLNEKKKIYPSVVGIYQMLREGRRRVR